MLEVGAGTGDANRPSAVPRTYPCPGRLEPNHEPSLLGFVLRIAKEGGGVLGVLGLGLDNGKQKAFSTRIRHGKDDIQKEIMNMRTNPSCIMHKYY